MSNIIKSQNDVKVLVDIIKNIDTNNINKSDLEEILKMLLPKDNQNLLINYDITKNGLKAGTFIIKNKKILFALNKIESWLDTNAKDFSKKFNVKDINTLRIFLYLFLITHEIEHSYQYLMATNIIEAPNKVIELGYKGICDILNPPEYIIPRPIKETRTHISQFLYKMNQNFYVIERNANIECTDLLCQCSLYMDREDMYKLFNYVKNTFAKIGYMGSTIGSLEETYRKILMYDRYKKFYEEVNMSEEEKVRFGLSISEEMRNKVLSLKRF